MLSNWRSRPRPIEKSVEQLGRITGSTGKSAEGETVADRPEVVLKRGNARGAKGPCCTNVFDNTGGKGGMITPPISLQDLRRRLYVKAKAELPWRFWGLYVHVCKPETLREAYRLTKENNGAPGIDGVTFAAIEAEGVEGFLAELREELLQRTYVPLRMRKVEIPKECGVRVLSVPAIRDRVVQGALKLILEPILEADFQEGSYAYRPQRSALDAVPRVAVAIAEGKTEVIDLDLRAYFDTVRHHIVLEQVASRVDDKDVMRLLKLILKASGKRGLPQGGVISPLLSNLYLNEVDKMLERAKEVTRDKRWTVLEYARFADDLVVLVDAHPRQRGLCGTVEKRLREEFAKLGLEVNEEKSRIVNLRKGESFGFLGFEFRRIRSRAGRWRPMYQPQGKKRTALLRKLKDIFRRYRSQPLGRLIEEINPILRGWVQYFAIGHSSRCFSYIRDWVEKKIRRHLARARQRQGFGWKRWSRRWLYGRMGLFHGYRLGRLPAPKAAPA
jgi:RNA-directed DNA polymerase